MLFKLETMKRAFFILRAFAITKTITNHGNDYAMMIYNFLEF